MKVLVTGANGLLGQKLVTLLQEDDHVEPVATARKGLSYKLTKGSFHDLDITSREAVLRVISETRPDFVVNAAAMTQVDDCETERDECWRQNVTGVENLVSACESVSSHIIHISTDFIFDGSHGPLSEEDLPNPINFYGQSKLAGEKVIQRSHCAWSILRTVLVYGTTKGMSRSNIVLWVKKSLEDGKPIKVVTDQWRTPTLAEDLAMGCLLAIKTRSKGIYHISGEEMMTPNDLAVRTAEFFKLDKSLITPTDSSKFKQTARRPLKTGFIIDKAKKELGYQPHSFADGLAIVATQLS